MHVCKYAHLRAETKEINEGNVVNGVMPTIRIRKELFDKLRTAKLELELSGIRKVSYTDLIQTVVDMVGVEELKAEIRARNEQKQKNES